jgi:hypothetical protein
LHTIISLSISTDYHPFRTGHVPLFSTFYDFSGFTVLEKTQLGWLDFTDVDAEELYARLFSAPRLRKVGWYNPSIIQRSHLKALEGAIVLAKEADRPFAEFKTDYKYLMCLTELTDSSQDRYYG